jgi:hypothetical protein
MIFTSRNYAIGRAHFQIAGGMRTMLILAIAYVGAVATVLGLFVYNQAPPRAYEALAALVMVIEAFVLVVIGSVRIGGCLRVDLLTQMIDSHRLMPVESWRAIAGYLFGTTIHVQLVTVLNVLFLAGLRAYTGLPFPDFVLNQLVLAIFALFVWTFAAMGSLMVRQIVPVMVLGFIFGGIFSISLREFAILPGLSVLASPFLGETIFSLSRGAVSFREAYPVALTAQIAFATLFFIGACRRYRGTYPSTFSVSQAIALGLVWSAESVAAIWIWESITPVRWGPQPQVSQQIVAALAVAALLAIVPAHALAALEVRRPLKTGELLASLVGATAVASFSAVASGWSTGRPNHLGMIWALTLFTMGSHVVTMYLCLRATRHMSQMAKGLLTTAVLFVVWMLPILLEVARYLLSTAPEDGNQNPSILTWLGCLSPLGLLITQWTQLEPPTPIPAILFQWLVPLALWKLGNRLTRNTADPPHPHMVPPATPAEEEAAVAVAATEK